MAKNSMAKGIAIGVLATAILAGGVCATGYASRDVNGKWFAESDFKQWTLKDKLTGDTGNSGDTSEANDVFMSDVGSNGGISLLSESIPIAQYESRGISREAKAAYTLTITSAPDNEIVTDFTWSAEFVNPSSAWANGKKASDYITITPTENNRSAQVVCNQAFGEPINVKCVYDGNESVFAVKQADYWKSITGVTATGLNGFERGSNNVTLTPTYGIGTLTPGENADWHQIRVELSTEAYNYITSTSSPAYSYFKKWQDANPGKTFNKQGVWNLYDGDTGHLNVTNAYYHSFINENGGNSNSLSYLNAAFRLLAENTTNQVRYELDYGYTAHGEDLQAVYYTEWESLNPNQYSIVRELSFNETGNLEFWSVD